MIAPIRQAAATDALAAVARAFDQATGDDAAGALHALKSADGPFRSYATAQAAREAAGKQLEGLRAAVDGAARATAGVSDDAHRPVQRAAQDVRHAIGELRLARPQVQDGSITLGPRADAVNLYHGIVVGELSAAETALSKLLGLRPR